MSVTLLEKAHIAIERGDEVRARNLLREALKDDQGNERAWLMYALVAGNTQHAIYCLKRVLKLNPGNDYARHLIESIRDQQKTTKGENEAVITEAETYVSRPHTISTQPEAQDVILMDGVQLDAQMWERIREIFENLEVDLPLPEPLGIERPNGWTWRCDKLGYYTVIGEEVREILGYSPDEFIGQPLMSYGLTKQSQIVVESTLQANVFPGEMPVYFHTQSGDPLLVKVKMHIFPSVDEDGSSRGLYGFMEVLDLLPTVPVSDLIQADSEPSDPKMIETRSKCPYIGLRDDPRSLAAYPIAGNYCYRLTSPQPIKISYQSTYCLTEKYIDCRVFNQSRDVTIRGGQQSRSVRRGKNIADKIFLWILVIAIIFMLIILVYVLFFQ
jgi:PAS domain-containing protein